MKSLRKKERRHVRDTTEEVTKAAKDPFKKKKKRQSSSIIYLTINDSTLIFIDS